MVTGLKLSLIEKEEVRAKALALGFDACGFATAQPVSDESAKQYRDWLDKGFQSTMDYLERNLEVRDNPKLLMENAKTLIVVALNYYPAIKQPEDIPQFSYYAYGKDYHKVIKHKLKALSNTLSLKFGGEYRACVDTAPLRERYWAQEAGIGFVGRNNQLIIPGKGSYFFIGVLLTSLEIEADERCQMSCGECGECVSQCPGQALDNPGGLNANKCLSCLTIEYRGELPKNLELGNRIYGCDRCQQICPHNKNAVPTSETVFTPSEKLLGLTAEQIAAMSEEEYNNIFMHSAVKRAGLQQLKRNLRNIKR